MTTDTQRQREFRARQASAGLAEVRGIWLEKNLHPDLKRLARALAKKAQRGKS
jgi:hypothetical protein